MQSWCIDWKRVRRWLNVHVLESWFLYLCFLEGSNGLHINALEVKIISLQSHEKACSASIFLKNDQWSLVQTIIKFAKSFSKFAKSFSKAFLIVEVMLSHFLPEMKLFMFWTKGLNLWLRSSISYFWEAKRKFSLLTPPVSSPVGKT